jgi:hypothetical protein
MAQERKLGDNGPPWAKMRSAVPPTKKDDIEDVAWALQTAEAIWSRGDYADALKWIRRAAEAASEAEEDDRALELAKAAADVASLLAADRPTAVAPPPILPPTPEPPQITTTSKAPPPPPPPPPVPVRPATVAPTPPKVGTNAPALPKVGLGQRSPSPPRIQAQVPVGKRGGRRSSPALNEEVTQTNVDVARVRRASVTNEKKRARASRPGPDETAQLEPLTVPHPAHEDAEVWPTHALTGEDDEDDSQYTRVGTPAYHEGATRASGRPAAMPLAIAPLVMSQAVRVVVWRGADGVHVAPAGTQVTAIGVEAVLVALDPSADLAAWLSNK